MKNIARGEKPKKRSKFSNITRAEWDSKIAAIIRLEEEAKELTTEIAKAEEELRQKEAEEEARRREIESSVAVDPASVPQVS